MFFYLFLDDIDPEKHLFICLSPLRSLPLVSSCHGNGPPVFSHMVVSCERPPQHKKCLMKTYEDELLHFKLTLHILSCQWGLLPWLKTHCPHRSSSGRTQGSHSGLGPSSELLLSEDKQDCFEKALNSEEKGAAWLVKPVWAQNQSSLLMGV